MSGGDNIDINTALLAAVVVQLQRLIPMLKRLLAHFGLDKEPPAPPAAEVAKP